MGPSPHLWLLHVKQRLLDQHTSLYGFQTSPVVLCMQNGVISTSLYGSQPSSVAFAYKTAPLGPHIQVCMGRRPHMSFFSCKTARFAPERLVSMAPSPHLWFLQAKQRLFDQNYKSLWVPDLTCRFVHANSVISTRITSFYGFQPSSVVLCIQNSDL